MTGGPRNEASIRTWRNDDARKNARNLPMTLGFTGASRDPETVLLDGTWAAATID